MIRGLNHINHQPNTPDSGVRPESAPTTVEMTPTRDQARSFGEHTLRFKRNIEEMSRITKSREEEANRAFDKLDSLTQKLMAANARTAQSLYTANTTAGRENKRR